MARRVVLAGGSGFIGTRLAEALPEWGYDEIVRIGRSGPDARWGDAAAIAAAVDGSDLLINLAGRSVGCRYTQRNRDDIYTSRIHTTDALREAVAGAALPPRIWLNASTATIYRYAMDRRQTEADGELGSGFSVDVARDWEDAFLADRWAEDLRRTRRVALRMAIVLGDGPALQMLARAAKFGLGGAQHDGAWLSHRRYRGIGPHATAPSATGHRSGGQQKFSWIHLDDVIAAIKFIVEHPQLDGPVNLAAPEVSTNAILMRQLRTAVRAPIGLPAFRWMLEPGMAVLRQESELVLKSRWAYPEKLLDAGFTFRWPTLPEAIGNLLVKG